MDDRYNETGKMGEAIMNEISKDKNKILPFPEAHSIRKRLLDRGVEQKRVTAISIASVIVGAVFLNNWIMSLNHYTSQIESNRRGVASVESESPSSDMREINWEHQMAKVMEGDKAFNGTSAKKPTMIDQMLYGELEGHYNLQMNQGKIEKISFNENQIGIEPATISHLENFILKYRSVLGSKISSVKVSSSNDQKEKNVFVLLDDRNNEVGHVSAELTEEGQLKNLVVF